VEIILIKIISVMNNIKDTILNASLKYYLQYGIRNMSNDKLAARLGISTKTFYKYFKSKQKLLEEATQLFHSQQYRMLENLPAETNAACLLFDLWRGGVEIEYKVNKAFFDDLHYYYPQVAKKVESSISKKFTTQFLKIIRRGIDDGDFRSEIIPEVALEGILVFYSSLVRTEHFKRFRLSSSQAFHNTLAIYIRGLCTKEGLQSLDDHLARKI
jgi:AcrR family transcriptional regulator